MGDLKAWLTALGLERYVEAFAADDVDWDALRLLTEADLEALGVTLGHRKKLLKALAELADAPAPQAARAAPPAPTEVARAREERRQLTVMFCDLVGSTELSRKLDPEDLREVMYQYQSAAREVIERYEGHIAQYLGDGLMVYFGWPRSHDDEAVRALRSALEIVERIGSLRVRTPLAVRIGVATGLVVVGEGSARDPSNPRTAVGETPNLAARLQALAGPNAIVASELTRELAGEAFIYDDLGTQSLKGIDAPVRAWSVRGMRAEDADNEGARQSRSLPLVGRDEEIGLLRRAWQQCKEGRGHVVHLSGEPGIGKTALVDTLAQTIRGEGTPRIVVRCSAYHTNSALYPVIEHVKKVIGWRQDGPAPDNVERLERTLGRYDLPLEEFVPPLASLLSLKPPEDRYPPRPLKPQEMKSRIFDCLTEWQLLEAERKPCAMVWEDLHWADPSTLEYLGQLIEQAPTASLLLVLTSRPDFVPPWPQVSHRTPITLNRLERPQIEALIEQLARGKKLPPQVVEHVVRKTDGVPLFVEELTKAILASGILTEQSDRFEQSGPLSAVAIPATLHESLMSRLDRLPAAKEVAQLGAVLGREFAYEMMRALGHTEEATLRNGLDQLVAGELLYQRGRPPRAKYVFKHALIQDAAYQSLLKRTRRQYHGAVAQLLATRFPEHAQTEPELLAYHYTGAEMPVEAIGFWLKAARRSAARSAYREALQQLQSGTELLAGVPEGRERTNLELQLHVERAFALLATRGMAAPETTEVFLVARDLCNRLGDEAKETYNRVSWALALSTMVLGQWQRARQITGELLERAQAAADVTSEMGARRLHGFALYCLGEFPRGLDHLERASALYDSEQHSKLAAVYGQDPRVGSLAIQGWVLVALGYPDRALECARAAVAHAERLAHPHSQAYALHYACVVHLERGEHAQALEQADAAIRLSTEYGFPIWLTLSKIVRGEALAALGRKEEGLAEIERGLAEYRATGTKASWPTHYLGLARTFSFAGRRDEAIGAVEQGLAAIGEFAERRVEAELYRVKGDLLREAGDGTECIRCYERALAIAREQNAKTWELRAATSLARARLEQGRPQQARELLAPVRGWFTEGAEAADIRAADRLFADIEAACATA
jgi:class 3 adenylate cyclase/tetratricopeptide (TPR) repeat protein